MYKCRQSPSTEYASSPLIGNFDIVTHVMIMKMIIDHDGDDHDGGDHDLHDHDHLDHDDHDYHRS